MGRRPGPVIHEIELSLDPVRDRGACSGADPDLFFPHDYRDSAQTDPAKAICDRCPVRELCLEYAVEYEREWGIWGGTTPGERRRIYRERTE